MTTGQTVSMFIWQTDRLHIYKHFLFPIHLPVQWIGATLLIYSQSKAEWSDHMWCTL